MSILDIDLVEKTNNTIDHNLDFVDALTRSFAMKLYKEICLDPRFKDKLSVDVVVDFGRHIVNGMVSADNTFGIWTNLERGGDMNSDVNTMADYIREQLMEYFSTTTEVCITDIIGIYSHVGTDSGEESKMVSEYCYVC